MGRNIQKSKISKRHTRSNSLSCDSCQYCGWILSLKRSYSIRKKVVKLNDLSGIASAIPDKDKIVHH